jgi:iron complex transport system permease protein
VKQLLTPSTYARLWIIWLLVAFTVLHLCMCVGPGEVGTHAFNLGWPAENIREIRMLRILSAGLVGFALSSAGVTLQALLRNPLADPYVLGISSGSSVGVFLWLLFGASLYRLFGYSPALQSLLVHGKLVPAVAGAILSCILVFTLARPRRGSGTGPEPLTLLLVGVVIAAVNGAILMVLNAFAPAGVQLNFLNYLMGAISSDTTWGVLGLAAALIAVGTLPLYLAGRSLNIGSLPDLDAASLGVNTAKLRTLCFTSASLTTAAAIMLAGPIGFVGLICPHICRRLVGADHRKLLVAAPLCGACFLMLADTFVNATGNLFHGELPVGVITALCGGPFFLFLLKRGNATGGTP